MAINQIASFAYSKFQLQHVLARQMLSLSTCVSGPIISSQVRRKIWGNTPHALTNLTLIEQLLGEKFHVYVFVLHFCMCVWVYTCMYSQTHTDALVTRGRKGVMGAEVTQAGVPQRAGPHSLISIVHTSLRPSCFCRSRLWGTLLVWASTLYMVW